MANGDGSSGRHFSSVRKAVKEGFLLFLIERSKADMSEEGLSLLMGAAAAAYDKKYKRDLIFRERCEIFMNEDEGEDKMFYESLLKDLIWDGSLREELKKNDNSTKGK